jgi:uncharacterized protein
MKFWNSLDIFTSTFQQTERSVLEPDPDRFNWRILIVTVTAAFSLLFVEYFGRNPGYPLLVDIFKSIKLDLFSDSLKNFMEKSSNPQIFQLIYWVCIILVFYILCPVLVIKFLLKDKIRNFGIQRGQVFKHYKIYIIMLLIMIPLVLFFSGTKSFQARYPFYRLKPGELLYPFFWIWQILYFTQFICVEFFFRGFLLHGLKHRFGYYSVFIMTIPYCMIHFGKPMPETISAIFAGIVLGTISLKSNSIWLGVAIHYSVAISMDLAALWQMGYFG